MLRLRLLAIASRLRPPPLIPQLPPLPQSTTLATNGNRSGTSRTNILSGVIPTTHRNLSTMAKSSTISTEEQWQLVNKPSVPPYSVLTQPVVKSDQDDREYGVIKLQNGLEAMLVHDATADKAAASLDVGVGHLMDPDDMPGLAHFCEHLLFMGTEQYPRENEYSEYLAKNNGASNAYTSTTNTNYFFDVGTSALPGALSRFSAFFHSPLFSPSCTARELNAVNSEHKKNHQSDIWRMFQLNKHLSKEGHVWNKFGSGNIDSLSKKAREMVKAARANANGVNGKANGSANGKLHANGVNGSAASSAAASPIQSRAVSPAPSSISAASSELEGDGGNVGREIRRRLVEWWSREYSANRMRLCVVGKESLDELSDTVSTLFSPIINREVEPLPQINDHPFGPNESGTLVSAETIMAFHCVEISFPLAYQAPLYKYAPGNFITHFIGHEGPGSVHSYLKQRGWITSLSAGPQPLGRGFAMLRVTLQLTKEGFDNYKEVILAVYKYFSLMRSSEFPAWYQREIAELRRMHFKFQEKRSPEDYATWISEHMAWPVPRHQVLSAPMLTEAWDQNGEGERQMREALDTIRIGRGRAVLMAKKEEHERIRGSIQWEHEPWYGTGYRVERFDEEFVAKAEAANDLPELFLPGPNEFIPTNLDVDKRHIDEPAKRPHLIRETALSSLWHKKDDRFWKPRASAIVDIRSPVAYESARASVLTRIYADLVTDSMTELAYDAELANLTYQFAPHNLGIFVTFSGYNDKLHVLAKDIFERARKLKVTQDRLHVIKSSILRDWRNFFMGQAFRLSDYYARYLLTEKQWPLDEKLKEVESITVEEVQAHIEKLLSQVRIKALVTGNMYKDEAIRLIETAEHALHASPAPEPVEERTLIPANSTNHVHTSAVPNPNEPNSAISYYVHIGDRLDSRLRVTTRLLIQLLSEPAFNILRTREQLGYVVSCGSWSSPGASGMGMRIVVQSERAPAFLEERIDAFLDEIQETIENMPEADFQEHKAGLETEWKEAPKNLKEETNRFWSHIDSGYLDFNLRESNLELLPSITKDDVLSLFKARIHYSSPTRAKISVHLRSQKPHPVRISEAALVTFVTNVQAKGVEVDAEKWREELFASGEPLFSQAVTYWQPVLLSESSGLTKEAAQELLNSLNQLAEQYPARSNDEGKLRPETKLIAEPKAFRSSLRISDLPHPVVEWGDLPVSKY